jgi:uncharacterized integral membrane protein
MRIIYFILFLLLAFIIADFSRYNSTPVHLQYYNYINIDVPAYFLPFSALIAGIIIGALWGVVERFRLNRTISRLNRTIRDMRKDLRGNEPPPIIEENKNPVQ